MSPHSVFEPSSRSGSLSTMAMPTPPQHSPSTTPSTTSFSLHRQPLLAHEMKKARNSKRLSLMVVPSPSFEDENTQNHNNNNHLHRMTPTATTFNNTIGNNTNSSSSTCSSSSNSNNYKSKVPSSLSLPIIVTPSPSFPPMTSSLSSRRAFTPAPLSANSLKVSASPATPSLLQPLSKRHSQLSLEEALPSPRFPIHSTTTPTTPTSSSLSLSPPTVASRSTLPSNGGPRTISAYFSDYSIECGAASPYVSEPVMVMPNLYLGAEHNATDLKTLKRLGITFVLNVAIEIAKDNDSHNHSSNSNIHGATTTTTTAATAATLKQCDGMREGIEYQSLAWTHHQRNLLREFSTAFRMMDEATTGAKEGGKVLVHCQLGVSRSASLVIACVMRAQGMGLSAAYDFVKVRSGVISPNMSLMYQLAEFEKDLQKKSRRSNIINTPMAASLSPSSPSSPSVPSSSTTPIGSRTSWSSHMDDDDDEEPPYPFAAAFSSPDDSDIYSAPPTLNDTVAMPMATTPIRQEFHKRPLTPDEHGRDEYPNNKPFQSMNSTSSSTSHPAHRLSSHSRLSASPSSASRRWSVGHSPLSKVSSPPSSPPSLPQRQCTALSLSPKTPTTEQFSSMCLSNEEEYMMMIPETPSFLQTSFSIPPLLSSSCSSSSASSVSSFEACSRPTSMNSNATSSHCSFFTACEDDDEEERQQQEAAVESDAPSLFSPRNSWNLAPVPKSLSSGSSSGGLQQQQKKKRRNLWSGLQTMQVLAEGAAAAAAAAVSSSSSSSSPHPCRFMEQDDDEGEIVGRRQNDKGMLFSSSHSNNSNRSASAAAAAAAAIQGRKLAVASSATKRSRAAPRLTLPLPDFIFSPRPYDTPAAQAASTTRSFGDVYQALFTTDSDML